MASFLVLVLVRFLFFLLFQCHIQPLPPLSTSTHSDFKRLEGEKDLSIGRVPDRRGFDMENRKRWSRPKPDANAEENGGIEQRRHPYGQNNQEKPC